MSDKPKSAETDESARHFDEWALFLRVDPKRLREAVRAVGISPSRIRRYLRLNATKEAESPERPQ